MDLVNYDTEEIIREATPEEIERCKEAQKARPGCGVFLVNNEPCYVRGVKADED